jgi:GNAT superfamily N-acetyltransferase
MPNKALLKTLKISLIKWWPIWLSSCWGTIFVRQLRPLPLVDIRIKGEFLYGSFVAPHPWIAVQCLRPEDSAVLGHVSYGVSPIFDRIYVDGLFIEPQFRGQGFARSLLLAVAQQASGDGPVLPITALHEVGTSLSFWNKLRMGAVQGLSVTMDIRLSEMNAERQRWSTISDSSLSPQIVTQEAM